MSAQHFPSGPWAGFYTYSAGAGKHRMDLSLSFANGRITGDGADPVGGFIIAGRYDAASGDCHWTKTNPGSHDVFYPGFREECGISGFWEIESASRGGFRIWPLGDENAEEVELMEAKPIEEAAGFPNT